MRVYVKGFGNPARGDDGIGPAVAERIERLGIPQVTAEADYQIAVEDAAEAAEHDAVVFVDAAAEGREPFFFRRVRPGDAGWVSTHDLAPEAVLALARDAYRKEPAAYLLGVRGYSFEMFTEGLTDRAGRNVEAACAFLSRFLTRGIER